MRRVLLLAGLLALAAPAPAGAATVELMVVGKQRVLREAAPVKLKSRSVRVGGRRCAVGRATPLSVLAGTRLKLRLQDYGSCGRSPRDAGALYVTQVGPDRRGGPAGWVYKVGRRAGTNGAADPAGPFGSGRVKRGRAGAVVLVRPGPRRGVPAHAGGLAVGVYRGARGAVCGDGARL